MIFNYKDIPIITDIMKFLNKSSTASPQYVGGGSIYVADPGKSRTGLQFLAYPNQARNEAWVIAKAGFNNNGPLRFRLVDQMNQPLSTWSETFSTSLERVKLNNVKIPNDSFPLVVKVMLENKSTNEYSTGFVEGVLLI